MSFAPSLTPDKVVHLRCLGDAASAPWLVIDPKTHTPRASATPDAGWIPRIDVNLSRFRLESVAAAPDRKKRFLIATPGSRELTLGLATSKSGIWEVSHHFKDRRWIYNRAVEAGEACLTLGGKGEPAALDDYEHPPGEIVAEVGPRQLFVAFPKKQIKAILKAEAAGDYSHMVPYGMTADGRIPPPPEKPKPLSPTLPRERANGDPVALELIAALQPSFDDGEGGPSNSDYPQGDPRAIDWPHNVVSLNTVATPTGIVHLHGKPVAHATPKGELERCRKLAAGVVAALGDLYPFGGDSPTPFKPFYLVIDQGEKPPKKLTADVIRAAFRGTLYPDTPIDLKGWDDETFSERPEWGKFIAWAKKQKDIAQLHYVCVGYDAFSDDNFAAIFPRLVLGLTKAGSLVGACGTIVQA